MQVLTQVNKFDSFFAKIPKVLNTLKLHDMGMYAPNIAQLLYNEIHTAYHGTKQPRLTTQYIDIETLPTNWKSLVTEKFRLNLVNIVSNSGMSYNNSNLPKSSNNKNSRKRVVEEEKLVEDDVYNHVIGKTKEAMYYCLNTGIIFYVEKYRRRSTRMTNGVAGETEETVTISLRSQMIAGRLQDAKLIDKVAKYFSSLYEFKLKDKAVENNPDENFITLYRLCLDANKELAAIATVPKVETKLKTSTRPNWNKPFSIPYGIPTFSTFLRTFQSNLCFKVLLIWSLKFSFNVKCIISAAASSREIVVGKATPSTTKPK